MTAQPTPQAWTLGEHAHVAPEVAPAIERAAGTVSSRELETLTGVSPERVRTWQRRFGFPASATCPRGRRVFLADDVPRVLALSQLVAAGEPVGRAVLQVQSGAARQIDTASLERSFGAVATPVVALAGPAPVEVVWANAAALATSPTGGLAGLPHALPDRSCALRAMLLHPPTGPVRLQHQPWFAKPVSSVDAHAPTEPVRAMAWACGSPQFVPAVLVVVDLPVDAAAAPLDGADDPALDLEAEVAQAPIELAPRRADARAEQQWVVAVGSARRALQRGVGRSAIDSALGALIAAGVVDDGLVLLSRGEELRTVLSARRRVLTAPISAEARLALRQAAMEDRPIRVDRGLRDELGLEVGSHATAVALAAGRVDLGYLVLVTDARPLDTHGHAELTMALGAALAAAISRDRAVSELRRIRG
ncbi:MAG: MerR family transcriptional regulator [Solirubrobacteraceae bacterium]|nr:MerR family transcriptional regulator [Solirubrobacteraceae bacterium]